jgi:hypothetical protein
VASKEVRYDAYVQSCIDLFKRGKFDFIVEFDGKRHDKQDEALHILTDNIHTEILYGGAGGGAKSWTGCEWLTWSCLSYPLTKWFVGRNNIVDVRDSTFQTFRKVFLKYGLEENRDWFIRERRYILFSNGSRIDFLGLFFMPTDPEYKKLGSKEYTGGWIEEAGEVHFAAFDTLKSRVGRHRNDEYGLLSKLFITCNPQKNWLYDEFYAPSVNRTLKPNQAFIPALEEDNPFNEKGYRKALESISTKATRERLLLGIWDYDDNPNRLCSHEVIMYIFNNDFDEKSNIYYLTADVARFGSDRAIIVVWKGWQIVDFLIMNTSKTTDIQDAINHLRFKYRIIKDNCIADEDGVGGGVIDNCGIKGFKNGSSPFYGENYYNLQSQCGYKLAESINNYLVSFVCEISEKEKEILTGDLGELQTWKVDSDGKLRIKPKEEIKKSIGRSPDWRDVLLMRAYFDYAEDIPRGVTREN